MRLVAAALLFACACVEAHHGSGVVGSPADMHTPPGDYVGYRVVTVCQGTWTDVGVIGTGAIELTTTAEIAAAGAELRTRLVDFTSIWGTGGFGLVCEPGVGTSVDLDDWRDVDALIVRIGEWLRERDYQLEVGIAVGAQPVPTTTI